MLLMLLCIATFRITRLVTRDKFPLIDIPREAFVQRWGVYEGVGRVKDDVQRNWIVRSWRWLFALEFPAIKGPDYRSNLVMKSIAYLWECDWCSSIWVGAAVVYTTGQYYNVPYPVLTWLATAAATGLLAQLEGVMDKKAE